MTEEFLTARPHLPDRSQINIFWHFSIQHLNYFSYDHISFITQFAVFPGVSNFPIWGEQSSSAIATLI